MLDLQKGDIDIVYDVTAEALDVGAKTLLLDNGESVTYSHLVIATGGRYHYSIRY